MKPSTLAPTKIETVIVDSSLWPPALLLNEAIAQPGLRLFSKTILGFPRVRDVAQMVARVLALVVEHLFHCSPVGSRARRVEEPDGPLQAARGAAREAGHVGAERLEQLEGRL